AERRRRELEAQGETMDYESVLAHIRARDRRDSTRATAPLVAAVDAITIDTSDMDIGQAVEAAIALAVGR
ncbi:MAG: (d)CMP kinase, partial [Aestuariivirga sp.]